MSPDKLPWATLRTLLSQCIYGGKIDNQFDQVSSLFYSLIGWFQILLDCVLQKLFTPKSFEHEHVLINKFDGDNALVMPDTTGKEKLIEWVESVKAHQVFLY